MVTIRRIGLSSLLFAACTLSCADDPTSPRLEPAADLVSEQTGDDVQVVSRERPLPERLSVTTRVGVHGGVISLPGAGLQVFVPFGAVTKPIDITIVAPAGELVGYHFFPEGIAFRAPLVVVQDLSGTDAQLSSAGLLAAYIEGEVESSVRPLERLPLDLSGAMGIFEIHHFSGYVVATN